MKKRFPPVTLFFFALAGLAISVCGALLYSHVNTLSNLITSRFDNERWQIPARVFSRPLELYPGKKVSLQDVIKELRLGGYQHKTRKLSAGEYEIKEGTVFLKTRDFHFLDGRQKSTECTIQFTENEISGTYDTTTQQPLDECRVDPITIGSFLPETGEDRILLGYKDLPQLFIDTLLAVEDRSFFSHLGIDPKGILRALYLNIRAGKAVAGGSTLTQQLVKNYFLSNERTLRRKFDEAIMAFILERKYSKEEILVAYCNEIFLGQKGIRAIHGFVLASKFYFGRELSQLDLSEIAMLVGIIKGPSIYNPIKFPKRSQKRRDIVLKILVDNKVIDDEQYTNAINKPIQNFNNDTVNQDTNYISFIDLVQRRLRQSYSKEDLTSQGLLIFSTLDPVIHANAQSQFFATVLKKNKGQTDKLQGAYVLGNRHTGEILSLMGGLNPRIGDFNRALDAQRQIGSLIKPAVYLTALHLGYTLSSIINDNTVALTDPSGKTWQPDNFDKKEHGRVMLYQGLAYSLNLATVNLGLEIGLANVAETLKKLGIQKDITLYPSLLLGSTELSPLQVMQMYQSIAASGFQTPLRVIRGVLNQDKKTIQRNSLSVEQHFSPSEMFLLQFALQEAVRVGTGQRLKQILPLHDKIAGKTGTTDNYRDSWFAGFTGEILGVVWMGSDNNGNTGLTGSSGAMVAWGNIVKNIQYNDREPDPPSNISWQKVSPPHIAASKTGVTHPLYLPILDKGERKHSGTRKGNQRSNTLQDSVESIFDSILNIFN